MNRRAFLHTTAFAAGSSLVAAEFSAPHLATNTYPWGTFARREGKEFVPHSNKLFAQIASTGLTGYEPIINASAEFDGLSERLRKHGLEMRSLYVNSLLHDADAAKTSIAAALDIARKAAEIGVKIIVTNPAPIRWGGPEDKTDAQLITQAASLNQLGGELKKLGITLAYHNHDSELRQGAREFHHMLTATDPELVKFCLDSHWIFRGCGDSQVALFDALEHYGSRIVELHLRQSTGGKWGEVFTAQGDIDHLRLKAWLDQHAMKPHLVLEQAIEKDSPNTLDAVTAHQQSRKNAAALFAGW
jgi:inosose dehydratase